jgi:hypothetical protein
LKSASRITRRHDHGGDGGGVGAAEQRRQHHAALPLGQFLEDITEIRDGADGHHDKPCLEGVEVELGELLVGQDGQNDHAQEEELGEGENFVGGDAGGQLFERFLEVEQQKAGDSECGRDPEMVVADERADEKRGQAGHLGGDAGGDVGGDFVPVGDEQKCGDDQQSDGQRQEDGAGEEGYGIADEADERKGAHAAKGVGATRGFVLLALEADQEGQEEHEDDLDGVRGQLPVDIHARSSLGKLLFPAGASSINWTRLGTGSASVGC